MDASYTGLKSEKRKQNLVILLKVSIDISGFFFSAISKTLTTWSETTLGYNLQHNKSKNKVQNQNWKKDEKFTVVDSPLI